MFKVFSSLRSPEAHFGHAQGHQRASSITDSINIFQITSLPVYEFEHQKTVYTKPWNQTIWFLEVIKEFTTTAMENKLEDKQSWKLELHCIPIAYRSILQKPVAKNYKQF